MLNEDKGSVLYVRLDGRTSEALELRCFELGIKKQRYIMRILEKELGLKVEPEPPKPGNVGRVPGVALSPPGKTMGEGERSCPSPEDLDLPRCPPEPESTPITPGRPMGWPWEEAPLNPLGLPTVEREDGFSLSEEGPAKGTGKKVRKGPMPADFSKTPGLLSYAAKQGVFEPEQEFEQFADYHAARGTLFLDWLAAWRTWVRNAVKFQARKMPNVVSAAGRRESEKMRIASQIFGANEGSGVIIASVSRRIPG